MNVAVLLVEEECEAPTQVTVKVKPARVPDQIEEAISSFKEIKDRITHITIITTDGNEPFVLFSEQLRTYPG